MSNLKGTVEINQDQDTTANIINKRAFQTLPINPINETMPKCNTKRIIGFIKPPIPKMDLTKLHIMERIPYLLVTPIIDFIDKHKEFVYYGLKKKFQDQLVSTYDEFVKQIEETSEKSKEHDITFVIITAHGNGKNENPYLKMGDKKFTYAEMLNKLDNIKGIKVLLIISCGSGRIKDVLETREIKEDYWAITSSYADKYSDDLICRKPWKLFDCPGKTLEDKFDKFKNSKKRWICQKATYIKGNNISL